ncbi:coiled-coil domain-containing protein MTMR15 [Nannizzia gypsea CBS 118893]|uniref:Fanconi-associated nuclease n=1 Tax=Arthroderma gypseum (strain ATCC MYA-4604 / CBS 118893) TaxID=535722 RepID=E4V0K0_ARTGP|nr:coiled-coil domain-containing protein MTMR15 [Nannizzia gypsea CBS 118893]EFR03137.1 coiled-coil domain-containing protein MTMR15 [Nannizzia gypsea CBS 118893]
MTAGPRPSQPKRRRTYSSPDDSSSSKRSGSTAERDTPDIYGSTVMEEGSGVSTDEPGQDAVPFDQEAGLEESLPSLKSGEDAVEEYEQWKASLGGESRVGETQQRFNQRGWVKGESSIYVDAFNYALGSVLEDESHLFNEAEKAVFDYWKGLPYESQYLYVRLFLRKTSAWHRVNKLGYYQDIADLPRAVTDLRKMRKLPTSTDDQTPNIGGLSMSPVATSGNEFRFADDMKEIQSIEEASSLLLLDELKSLAKDLKVAGKNKKDLINGLCEASTAQTGLSWLSSTDAEEGIDGKAASMVSSLSNGETSIRAALFREKIFGRTGDCIRLANGTLKLFERVHLLFYRSTQWSENSLTAIILAKISKKNYPDYIVSRSNSIFPSRSDLLEFETALRIQFDLDKEIESSNTAIDEKIQAVKKMAEAVYPRWRILLLEEQSKEERLYDYGEGAYLRRFSPAWVYTRIIHKGLWSLGRLKDYKQEHKTLKELLGQRLFHSARRGTWYQRKALLEEHYMWSLDVTDTRPEDARKRDWRQQALRTCEDGLQDPECHIIFHYGLQKRITKLERSLKIAWREQHDFSHVMLAKPEERMVHGIRIEKELPGKQPNGKSPGSSNSKNKGRPTVWVDEREGGGECRVENMCLSWYRDNGWKGFHCESGILRTLFGYLFYDIIFTYVPNVFQTPFQTCPLDLHTDSFYPSRISEINSRLAEISNGEAQRIIKEVHARESPRQTCAIGIDWSFELGDLLEIAQCFRGEALATICQVMAQEYQQRGGGIPDLFLWRMDTNEVMFSEVKSESDRLSDTQRLWIHVLTGAGVKVELCNAVAREVRRI